MRILYAVYVYRLILVLKSKRVKKISFLRFIFSFGVYPDVSLNSFVLMLKR